MYRKSLAAAAPATFWLALGSAAAIAAFAYADRALARTALDTALQSVWCGGHDAGAGRALFGHCANCWQALAAALIAAFAFTRALKTLGEERRPLGQDANAPI